MGKKNSNFEKNGSHLSGYNAKLAEMREKAAKRKAEEQAAYLQKMQQAKEPEAEPKQEED